MAFPEQPAINNMQDYDPLRGYVHTTTNLRWSYPSMNGRPQDWAQQTQSLPLPTLIDGVIAGGFTGLWVDRDGYADNGATIVSQLQTLLHAAPLTSRDGRFEFFDLRPYAAQMRAHDSGSALAALRASILHPAIVAWGAGFYSPEPSGSRWTIRTATASADNTSHTARRAEFYADVQTLAKGHFTLTVSAPGGVVGRYAIGSSPTPVFFSFTLPPGMHDITFTTNAPVTVAPGDARQLDVHYGTPVLSYAGFTPFLPGQPDFQP
jgi:phosphoglycerol transferase